MLFNLKLEELHLLLLVFVLLLQRLYYNSLLVISFLHLCITCVLVYYLQFQTTNLPILHNFKVFHLLQLSLQLRNLIVARHQCLLKTFILLEQLVHLAFLTQDYTFKVVNFTLVFLTQQVELFYFVFQLLYPLYMLTSLNQLVVFYAPLLLNFEQLRGRLPLIVYLAFNVLLLLLHMQFNLLHPFCLTQTNIFSLLQYHLQ